MLRTRLPFFAAVAVAVCAAALAVRAAAPAADEPERRSTRPNVIVVMTDDQTLRDMSAMPRTRALIGGAGVTFTRAYVSYPLCCPSRATFLTGRYAHNHGVRTNSPPGGGVEALDAQHTLPVWLEAAGYDTSHIGKYLNGYGFRHAPTVPPGWSDWHGSVDRSTYQMWGYTLYENGLEQTYGNFYDEEPALYQTDVFRDKAVEVVRAHGNAGDDADPFFLSLAFVAPHGESAEPGETTEPYVRPAPRHEGRFATLQPPRAAVNEGDVSDKPPYVRGLQRLHAGAAGRIAQDFRARRESLLAVDEAVAALVSELEQSGQLERTYILFTSDNGFFQGEHRIPKGKYLAYEPSTHVPLLIRGPGIPAGVQSDELTTNTDLAATVLDAGGAVADREVDGRSLLPFARDPLARSARPIVHEGLVAGDTDRDFGALGARRSKAGVYYAIRTDRYLYVKWRGGPRELYDHLLDPNELRSRHADPAYALVRQRLSDAVAWLRHCRAASCNEPLAPLPEPAAVPLHRNLR